jgi:rubrerythrin
MVSCPHSALELLPARKRTLRCRYCHLTIDGADVEDGCCPECLEKSGQRRYEFEELKTSGGAAYRCEECGAIIKSA